MLLNVFKEGENPACVVTTRYSAQRFNADGVEKVRVHHLLSGQNGENRTFEFKRSKTLDVPSSESAKAIPVAGSKRVAKKKKEKRVAEKDSQREESVPLKKKTKKCPLKEEDGDVEFQFAIHRSGRIDMF